MRQRKTLLLIKICMKVWSGPLTFLQTTLIHIILSILRRTLVGGGGRGRRIFPSNKHSYNSKTLDWLELHAGKRCMRSLLRGSPIFNNFLTRCGIGCTFQFPSDENCRYRYTMSWSFKMQIVRRRSIAYFLYSTASKKLCMCLKFFGGNNRQYRST